MVYSADKIEKRRADWQKLETMLSQMKGRRLRGGRGQAIAELSDLYRAACADLAMADQYRLSPQAVTYLHGLVGRAHNTIYKSRNFQYSGWGDLVFRDAPQQIFGDRCVHICAVMFFGLFALSAFAAYNNESFPQFAEAMIGPDQMTQMSDGFAEMDFGRSLDINVSMVAFYIQHNTGIGLECFGFGILVVPGLVKTAYNATLLGASFGYMARPETDGGDQFLEFVTAHGAFELTAIALAAAAGLRIGSGWLFPRGLKRTESVKVQGQNAIPVMAASGVLFFLAALTEGLLSPSSLPYVFKAAWGVMSSGLMMIYFVILGYPWAERQSAA